MEALICSSSFLPRHPHLLHVPTFRINYVKVKPTDPTIIKSTFFNPINPLKKLLKHTPQTLNIKNPPPHDEASNKQLQHHPLLAHIFNTFDAFICAFLDPPLPHSIDPKRVLSGNFSPVDEVSPTPCTVEGSLPSCLNGAYIRNGPNPQFIPKGPYHFLDGDGMLHVIKISRGEATFCSRYVKTHKYEAEREMGIPIVPNFFAFCNGSFSAMVARLVLTFARTLMGQFDPFNRGFGVANTSVALLGGRLFALCESDLPYEVKVTDDGDVITLGRHDFGISDQPFLRMTAHPKIDRQTGDAFAYRYDVTRPFQAFYRIACGRTKQKDVPIYSKDECTFMHDFGLTKRHAIFPETQIVIKPLWVLRGRSPVRIDSGKVPRLGIIPRYAADESEMWWIDAPGFNVLHCVNAWEEEGEDGGDSTIVMVASNVVSVEHIFDDFVLSELTLEKITIDVKAKSMERHPLSARNLDFGVINPAYATKKNRYVYAAVIGSSALVGVVKLDLSVTNEDGGDCTVASRLYGSGWHGGEPFFVSREPNNPAADEDDGYLITYVHDENNQESKFLVMNAKSPTLDIVSVVKLPQRVPTGFHGFFLSENDLKKL